MLPFLFGLFLIGICFGSFVTAISWRIPREISFIKGRSICPKCRKNIRWYDNIPLLSYFVLGGRCRNCKSKISFRYPAIEFTSGIGFVLITYFIGINNVLKLVLALAIFIVLLAIFVIDLENQIIPDPLVFTGIGLVLLYLWVSQGLLIENVLSGFLAASFLMIIHMLTKGRGMGLGDVKFAVLGGMLVGLKLLYLWLLASFLTGGIAGIILILARRAKMKTKVAFGPFLIVGIGIVLTFGNQLLELLTFI